MNSAAQRIGNQQHGHDEGKQQPANMDEEMALDDGVDQRDAIP